MEGTLCLSFSLWMLTNKLNLNGNKTELIEISNRPHLNPPSNTTMKLGIDHLTSPSTQNLIVTFHNKMLVGPHVQALCKSANYQLFYIRWIWKYLTPEANATLVHSFIMSSLDYCNSILYSLPKTQLYKLQPSLNSMAGEQCQKSKGYTHKGGAYALPIFLQSNSPILTCKLIRLRAT